MFRLCVALSVDNHAQPGGPSGTKHLLSPCLAFRRTFGEASTRPPKVVVVEVEFWPKPCKES
eukprot:8954572-Karenia_brevis.AAC.1